MPDRHLSLGDAMQMIPIEWENVKVKREDAEESQDDNKSPASEDVSATCSFIKVEIKTDNEMPDDAAVEQDDTELYHNALGLHTECDIVKEESFGDANARDDSGSDDDSETNDITQTEADDVLPSALVSENPRLIKQMNYDDTPAINFARSDQTKDKIEEPKSETKRAVDDKPVENNKIVETRDKIDIRLRNDKQNDGTSDHNDAHKEMSENKISADQSVNSRSSNKLKQLLCDTCPISFRGKCALRRHRTNNGEKHYKCNVCKKCFVQKGYLDKHMRTHTGKKPYQCNVCKKCFVQKGNLDDHMRTHTGEKPYQCNVCTKSFNRKGTLDIHMRTHTGEKPYQCNVCKKCFNEKGSLDKHTRTHTGEKPYQCNVCKKCFSEKGTLDKHTRTHTGEKPYQCNVCKKCFRLKSHLDGHTRTHTGEKPYQCNVCKICFNEKSSLDKHTRTHTGEKPYLCNVCKKCFNRKGNLDRHTLTHTDEKPFQCDICKKCFSQKCNLNIHILTHTCKKPYN